MPPLDGYSTGMSQPLNSTIFAPIRRWTVFSAVLRTVGVVASTAGKGNLGEYWQAAGLRNHLPYHAARKGSKEPNRQGCRAVENSLALVTSGTSPQAVLRDK